MHLTELQSVVGFIISVVTFSGGIIAFWQGSVKKRYAAEREFVHLKNNQLQISEALAEMAKDADERGHRVEVELVQIKSLLMAVLAKSGDSISSILKK